MRLLPKALRCIPASLLAVSINALAQTSQVDSLTYANPDQFGAQAADNDNSDNCCHPRISDDGRHVLFLSFARNLVAGDHNNNVDVFVRDRTLGTTRRVNVRSDGAQGRSGDAASAVAAAISANGDLVVFSSRQFDLVSGDNNLSSDVFLHQVSTGLTTRLVLGIGGAEPNDAVLNPSLSGDGRFVVFESGASNLAPNQSNFTQHVYLLDRNSGVIERISVTPGGNPAGGGSGNATVSDDGRFVAFESSANDLVATPGNGNAQLYVRDRQLGVTTRLSQVAGVPANLPVLRSVIAGNGSRVAFETAATNLDAGDTNGVEDIYAVSVATGVLTRVSVGTGGAQTSDRSQRPSISRNGQRIAFQSPRALAAGSSSSDQIYIRDLDLQTTTLVSVNNAGNNGNQDEVDASLSGNGQVVAFNAASNDLVGGDSNNLRDRFARDLLGNTTERISLADAAGPFPSQANGDSTSSIRGQRQLSADARFLVTATSATNLGSLDLQSPTTQIVRIDRQGNVARLISVDINGNQALSSAFDPAISSDGRFLVFRSNTTNLVPGDSNNASDIFWLDANGGGLERVNLGPGGVQGLGGATTTLPSVSDDGNAIAFVSNQNNLVTGDTNSAQDIFVRDRGTGTTTRVSVDSSGAQANGLSDFPVISANGRFVVYSSLASNLVAGDVGGFQDIFRHDRQTGQTLLISQSSGGVQGNGNSFISAISADGNRIAFSSAATNLVSGDSNARTDIFVRDVIQGTTTLVSVSSSGELGNGTCSVPSISADGQIVSFLSGSSNLVAGDSNNLNDLFRHDLTSSQTTRMSVDPDGRQVRSGQATVTAGQVSPDGSVVAVESNVRDWQLGTGVSGARSILLATPATVQLPDNLFGNGFE
ncbi:MAG: TolB family protein [Lysobacterales bacterium]